MDRNVPHTSLSDFAPGDLLSQIETLLRALEDARLARAAVENESAAKSDLLATASHEIRTPLGAIISTADLLLASDLDDTQRRYAETLRQSGRGLLAILNDILDYSKLSAGRFELETVRFDFAELMRTTGAALAARAGAKGLSSRIDITEGCPTHLIGDPARLRQVLNNLIDNALKFTEEGSVNIRAGFGSNGAETVLRFEIVDTGIGVAGEQQARLFEPYTQRDSSIAAKYGGTGLGLSIARRLVTLMGGEIGCESVEGRGSVFWFTARLRQPDERTRARRAPERSYPGDKLSGHVLVVEDNDINRMLIAAYLDSFGLTHETAASGRAALEALTRKRFDLVLMDIMMPEMDGVEAMRHIRALDGPVSGIPVIALTANAMKGDRETYLAAGADGYVSKPVSAADLFDALGQHLGQASADARSVR